MEDTTSPFTSKGDEEFFGAIGRLVISWAQLDLGLDCMVEILYRVVEGNTTDYKMPWQLQTKIDFLRRAIRKTDIGPKAIDGYLSFFERVELAAKTRHDIIHGSVVEQVERSGLPAGFGRGLRASVGNGRRVFQFSDRPLDDAR
jgi:hypothetical protein